MAMNTLRLLGSIRIQFFSFQIVCNQLSSMTFLPCKICLSYLLNKLSKISKWHYLWPPRYHLIEQDSKYTGQFTCPIDEVYVIQNLYVGLTAPPIIVHDPPTLHITAPPLCKGAGWIFWYSLMQHMVNDVFKRIHLECYLKAK